MSGTPALPCHLSQAIRPLSLSLTIQSTPESVLTEAAETPVPLLLWHHHTTPSVPLCTNPCVSRHNLVLLCTTCAFVHNLDASLHNPCLCTQTCLGTTNRNTLKQHSTYNDLLIKQVLVLLISWKSLHQEKSTVPFITIDHYIPLFVTFVAIHVIIALWHP